MSSLATRILEIKGGALVDFQGSYDEYLASQQLASLPASAGSKANDRTARR